MKLSIYLLGNFHLYFKQLSKNNSVTLIKIKDAPHFIALFAPDSFTSVVSKFMKGRSLKSKTLSDKNTLLK